MPRWIIRSLIVCALVGALFTAALSALALSGDNVLPHPISALVAITLATSFTSLLIVGCTHVLARFITRTVAEVAGRMDRRMGAIGNAMVEHGIRLDDITGEIPKARPLIVACQHDPIYAGRAQVAPSRVDPEVIASVRRLESKVSPFHDR